MKNRYRRGLAIVLEGGSWTDTDPAAATCRVLSTIRAQENDRNEVSIEQGSGIHKLDHILVVWTSRAVMKRLHDRVRLVELGDASMTFIRLDPQEDFEDVRAEDFRVAQRRMKANTHRIRALAVAKPAAATEPESSPSEAPADPPAAPAETPAEAPPPAEAPAETPAVQASLPDANVSGQAEIIELKQEKSTPVATTVTEATPPSNAAEDAGQLAATGT